MGTQQSRTSNDTYRPWLDGVRACAISLVILEHLGVLRHLHWSLGGVGVGVFFALSGYLITGLLLTELERTDDIALRRFYVRRLARLAPALVAMVLICNVFFWWLDAKREVFNSIFALTYLTNYGTIFQGRHLAGYGHTWSLAVEEHFYLVWPVLMLLMARRFDVRRMLLITIAICLAVLAWRSFLSTFVNPRVLYVGSVERADALLYGCAGAMLVRLGWRPPKILFYVGLAMIAACLMRVLPWVALSSSVLAIGSTFVLVCLDYCDMRIRRVLSFAPVVWIGVMSYGIYLWHGPFLKIGHKLGFESLTANLVMVGLVVLIAFLSNKFLEIPLRQYVRSRERDPQTKTGVAVSPLPVEQPAQSR